MARLQLLATGFAEKGGDESEWNDSIRAEDLASGAKRSSARHLTQSSLRGNVLEASSRPQSGMDYHMQS